MPLFHGAMPSRYHSIHKNDLARAMEAAWRPPALTGARPEWMEPFARTIDAAKKHVVSSTLDRVDWNAELVRGDLGKGLSTHVDLRLVRRLEFGSGAVAMRYEPRK